MFRGAKIGEIFRASKILLIFLRTHGNFWVNWMIIYCSLLFLIWKKRRWTASWFIHPCRALACRSLNQNLSPVSDIHSLSGGRRWELAAGEVGTVGRWRWSVFRGGVGSRGGDGGGKGNVPKFSSLSVFIKDFISDHTINQPRRLSSFDYTIIPKWIPLWTDPTHMIIILYRKFSHTFIP